MSDLPRFDNVDLTPTWDDVDPAELDFGGGAIGSEPFAAVAEAEAAELNPPPIQPADDHVEDAEVPLLPDAPAVEDDVEVELPPPVETTLQEEPVDEFAGLDDGGLQFASGPIGADSVPDDFDLP